MLIAICIAVILFVACGAFHYSILIRVSALCKHYVSSQFIAMQITLVSAGVAHLLEAALYAGGFQLARLLELGGFSMSQPASAMDIFYFSIVNYTSLGLGDIYPTGHLRFLAGVESLNGFLLISCSASALFMQMKSAGESSQKSDLGGESAR